MLSCLTLGVPVLYLTCREAIHRPSVLPPVQVPKIAHRDNRHDGYLVTRGKMLCNYSLFKSNGLHLWAHNGVITEMPPKVVRVTILICEPLSLNFISNIRSSIGKSQVIILRHGLCRFNQISHRKIILNS